MDCGVDGKARSSLGPIGPLSRRLAKVVLRRLKPESMSLKVALLTTPAPTFTRQPSSVILVSPPVACARLTLILPGCTRDNSARLLSLRHNLLTGRKTAA